MERKQENRHGAVKSGGRFLVFVLFLAAVILLVAYWGIDVLTLENIQKNQDQIRRFAQENHAAAVTWFILVYFTTAFFVPGALLLTLVAGFLFGVFLGTLYVIVGDTLGCVGAFLLSRYLIGDWVQEKFHSELQAFNREVALHGHNYLFALRVLPVLPSFLVNYFAGLTRIPLKVFALTTSLGSLPGAAVYAFAGRKLGEVRRLQDLFSGDLILVFGLLGVLAILPAAWRHLNQSSRGKS